MEIAIWIIAACEVARAVQNWLQLRMFRTDREHRDNAYNEIVESKRDFSKMLMAEFEKMMQEEEPEEELDKDDGGLVHHIEARKSY